ncbi:hypothetical protein [Vibrio casei]|uniref:hypothetical protein n=1 Tax=Vibrio casei TaxID=673372 RepID=UPI00097F2A49|nr:hypothetical protein [Vibrio casei]SJN24463.1 hypothetical protein FM109_05510 [Vibrio casei]
MGIVIFAATILICILIIKPRKKTQETQEVIDIPRLEDGMKLATGDTLYWYQGVPVKCQQSSNSIWKVGQFRREGYSSNRDDTITLLENGERKLIVKVYEGASVKALCVANNGTFVFSAHHDPDVRMGGIVVLNKDQKEVFKVESSTNLISSSISDNAQYLALSFAGSYDKTDPHAEKVEVFDITTGEVVTSINKTNDIRYADIVVTEPNGDVLAYLNDEYIGLIRAGTHQD